ncbi:MAG TPA: hypothetical protein VFR81_29535 [Longimicrobium sp.]|nr:hypothetical protein [Longimicrobium sp.]
MDLISAIEAFNEAGGPQIELLTTRDGRVRATLPRLKRDIIVEGSRFNKDVKVTAADVAALCEEARLAFAPGMALLQAAIGALNEMEREDAKTPA